MLNIVYFRNMILRIHGHIISYYHLERSNHVQLCTFQKEEKARSNFNFEEFYINDNVKEL